MSYDDQNCRDLLTLWMECINFREMFTNLDFDVITTKKDGRKGAVIGRCLCMMYLHLFVCGGIHNFELSHSYSHKTHYTDDS